MKTYKDFDQVDSESIAQDARELLSATVGVAGERVSEARERLGKALDRARQRMDQARQKAVAGARAADTMVRENPYSTVGIALGVGALVGFLVGRRNRGEE